MARFAGFFYFALLISVAIAIKIVQYKEKEEEKQDFSKIPGIPGHDYPIYHEVPETNFDCNHVPAIPGEYPVHALRKQIYFSLSLFLQACMLTLKLVVK